MMSARKAAASSSTPWRACSRVPAAHSAPSDMALLPSQRGSRSATRTSAPLSRAASAAVRPQAPPPITSIATSTSNARPSHGSSVAAGVVEDDIVIILAQV